MEKPKPVIKGYVHPAMRELDGATNVDVAPQAIQDHENCNRQEQITERVPEISGELVDDSEDGLALGFINEHPEFKWIDVWNQWYVWNGFIWKKDETLLLFTRVREYLRRAASVASDQKNVRQFKKAITVAAVEKLARSDSRAAATVDQWDRDPWLLNTQTGILNLKTGQTDPHNPLAYMTKITKGGPKSGCPRWLQFLAEVTDGDQELVDFLQRVVGYSLTGSVREHALVFFYGTGRNGKGVFLNTLVALLSDYASVASMEVLMESRGGRHPTELAALRGKRLVIAQEVDEGKNWAEATIKALTGGDPITARYMRQDFFTFDPQFKLMIAGNHKPAFRNIDEAIRSRLHLIPFTVTFPKEKRDPDLAGKLKGEFDGILQWAIEGTLQYLEKGLAPPKAVKMATDEYFAEEDIFRQWIDDKCKVGPDEWETPTLLFNSWKNYAEGGRFAVGDQKAFKQRLVNAGFQQKRTGQKGRHYSGLKVIPEHNDEWQDSY